MIRVKFHELLEEKVYPTLDRLLKRIHQDLDDFPIHSKGSLSKVMKTVSNVFTLELSEQEKKLLYLIS